MGYGSQTRNPHEHTAQDEQEDQHVYCRGCNGHLGLREDLTPENSRYWNQWWWCVDCGDEMERLAQNPDPVNEVRR